MIPFFLVCETNDPFRCNDTRKCIDIDHTCDGVEDCENGFDEKLQRCKIDSQTTTAAETIETDVTATDETTLQPQSGKHLIKEWWI